MGDASGIEWTDATWNPVRGCRKISPGCKHCYAETFAERWRGVPGHPYSQGFDLRLVPELLDQPLRWQRPRRIFVNSMSDLHFEDVPTSFVDKVVARMLLAPRHTFQVLTKRASRMREYWSSDALYQRVLDEADVVRGRFPKLKQIAIGDPARSVLRPWIHLGVSVEDRKFGLPRIDDLRATPAALRFLSIEPLLEDLGELDLRGIGWVIIGGESGPGARPCEVNWIRSIVGQCGEAGVPVFVKQLGARPTASSVNDIGDAMFAAIEAADMATAEMLRDGCLCELRLIDRKGGNPDEWPEDLRVRQLPGGAP